MSLLLSLLAQTAAPPPSFLDQPAVQVALATAAAALIMAASNVIKNDFVKIVHAFSNNFEANRASDSQRKRAMADEIVQHNDQNKALFEIIREKDELILKVTQTVVQTQEASNSQAELHKQDRRRYSRDRRRWKKDMADMMAVKDTEIKALTEKLERTEAQNKLLKERLSKYEPVDDIILVSEEKTGDAKDA